jgi:hypothetical protein
LVSKNPSEAAVVAVQKSRTFTAAEIKDAFETFDLDKNNYVGQFFTVLKFFKCNVLSMYKQFNLAFKLGLSKIRLLFLSS